MSRYFNKTYRVGFVVRLNHKLNEYEIIILKENQTHILQGWEHLQHIWNWAEKVCRG